MQPQHALLTPAEYLAQEENSPVKSEYVDGESYAMSGAKRAHNLIASNLLYRARGAASHRPACQVFGPDMKVHVEAHNCFYYPDLSVCCDPTDRDDRYLVRPCFIVEVTSPSTAAIDRREKRASYLTLTALEEYVIVDQGQMWVELFRRAAAGWRKSTLIEPDEAIESSCLGLHLDLRQIYEGVELPPVRVGEPELPEYAAVA